MNRRRFLSTSGSGLALAAAGLSADGVRTSGAEAATASSMAARRRLFLDASVVEEKEGLERRFHALEKHPANPVLIADRPWETGKAVSGPYLYGTVLKQGDRLRMWYQLINRGNHVGYAESKNGLHWNKPELGIIEHDGSRRNNLVVSAADREATGGECHNPSVIHCPWQPDPERRYALFGFDTGEGRPRVAFSADGLRWRYAPDAGKDGLFRSSDVVNFFRDHERERFVATWKTKNRRGRPAPHFWTGVHNLEFIRPDPMQVLRCVMRDVDVLGKGLAKDVNDAFDEFVESQGAGSFGLAVADPHQFLGQGGAAFAVVLDGFQQGRLALIDEHILLQALRRGEDGGEQVVDVVGQSVGHRTEAAQALRLHQAGFHGPMLGVVEHRSNQAMGFPLGVEQHECAGEDMSPGPVAAPESEFAQPERFRPGGQQFQSRAHAFLIVRVHAVEQLIQVLWGALGGMLEDGQNAFVAPEPPVGQIAFPDQLLGGPRRIAESLLRVVQGLLQPVGLANVHDAAQHRGSVGVRLDDKIGPKPHRPKLAVGDGEVQRPALIPALMQLV